MVNIRYICVSDLQCGAPTSLLTTPGDTDGPQSDPPAQLSATFGAAMADLFAKVSPQARPDLILLGDILDLSLGTPAAASASLSRFLRDLGGTNPASRFGKAYFVPGNHDHQLWTAQRFQSYAATGPESRWSHVTPAFLGTKPLPGSAFLQGLLESCGFKNGLSTHYPNLGLINPTGDRAVFLHHGHFLEALYTLMSRLVTMMSGPDRGIHSLEEMEKLNSSWIDFFWSTIGDNGLLGRELRLVYEYLLTGGEAAAFQHRLARLIARLMEENLAMRTGQMEQTLETLSTALVDYAVGSFGQTERFSYNQTLGSESQGLLREYLRGPALAQIRQELGNKLPTDLSFVFGHTHKPFEAQLAIPTFGLPPSVYNTGGWILDTPVFGTREGASVLIIDDQLNVASIRLFNAPEQDGGAPAGLVPRPVQVLTASGQENALSRALKLAVAQPNAAWSAFALAADAAYRDKQNYILETLAAEDLRAQNRGELL
jgi:hypothetical protein